MSRVGTFLGVSSPLLVHSSERGHTYPLTLDNATKAPISAISTSIYDVANLEETLRLANRGLNALTNQNQLLVMMCAPPHNMVPIANDKGITVKLTSGDIKVSLEESIRWVRLIKPQAFTTLAVCAVFRRSLLIAVLCRINYLWMLLPLV